MIKGGAWVQGFIVVKGRVNLFRWMLRVGGVAHSLLEVGGAGYCKPGMRPTEQKVRLHAPATLATTTKQTNGSSSNNKYI